MGRFLHHLWVTLAFLACCGLSMPGHWFCHGNPDGSEGCLQQILIATPASCIPHVGAGSLRNMAKRPTGGAEAKSGLRPPRRDGDGPSPDPILWMAVPLGGLSASHAVPGSRLEGGWPVLQGMDPKQGGKRAPPMPARELSASLNLPA